MKPSSGEFSPLDSSSVPPQARVDPSLLRLFFNTSDIIRRLDSDHLTETIVRDNIVPVAKCKNYGFPQGTHSQFVIYREGSQEVARAHRYLLPNGQVGGSGLPDPKRIICCGVILYC